MNRLRSASLLAVAGAALTLAACSGYTTSTSTPSSATAAGECSVLTANTIALLTGESVRAAPRGSFAGAGGTCGNYTTDDGRPLLGVNDLQSGAEFRSTVAAVPADIYTVSEHLDQVGDEAILFKDRAETPRLRYLVARQENRGVVLFPLSGGSLSDAQLQQLAVSALAAH
jgi:hypothetical protein